MSKIVRLEAENVKRLVAVEVKPDGNIIVVGGRNGQGKTSLLDSIMIALGGAKALPAEPVRKGAKKAHAIVETEDLVITRKMSAGGNTSLEVKGKDGRVFPSPQMVLDKLCGALAFDPLEFSRQKPEKQLETLKALVGLDFAELDSERAALYSQRTDVGRQGKTVQGALDKAPFHEGAPDAEVSVAELSAEVERRQAVNSANAEERRKLSEMRSKGAGMLEEIERTEQRLATLKAAFESFKADGLSLAAKVEKLVDEPTAEVRAKMATAEESNRKVRENAAHRKLVKEWEALAEQSEKLTAAIDTIDAKKSAAVQAAKFPVEGLGLGDAGVTLNGLPLEQASSAEQLRASVAIGIALNRDLKVLLIRDGSLLDADSLKLVAEMAEASGSQVWIERVGEGAECSVIIEDGAVKGAETKSEAA